MRIRIGDQWVGDGERCFAVAEIGANHNGDITTALGMIRAAHEAGADAVKFQKRTLELAIPPEQQSVMRDTPWGRMSYIDYRRKLEFGKYEFQRIDDECQRLGIAWFSSVWDVPSLDFLLTHFSDMPAIKIPSACLTDDALLMSTAGTGKVVIMSTGMSTAEEIGHATDVVLDEDAQLVLLHCKSVYPADPSFLNLRAIRTLMGLYGDEAVIGYSGHEVGLWTTLMAVVLGAKVVERHFTTNRAMWGTDQAASVEPHGLAALVKQFGRWQEAEGDGSLGCHPSEWEPRRRLRKYRYKEEPPK
jgi:N-acetylneuraminate synthase